MRPLLKRKVTKRIGDKDVNVGFNPKGNKHLYADTFGRAKGLNKFDLKNIDKALLNSTYVKSSPLSKPRKDGITKFHYFRDDKKKIFYNVAERTHKGHTDMFLYSVTDTLKK